MLSGDEVRAGARRQTNWNQDWNRDGRVDNLDSQIAQRFRGYDMNNDNRVARSEWPGDQAAVHAARHEPRRIPDDAGIHAGRRVHARLAQGGPSYRFSNIDMNSDGWVTRNEWNMGNADFNRLDVNRDNRISRFEFENDTAAYNDYRYSPAQFNAFDANRDGWLTRPESRMATGEFDRLDTNSDNRISRFEFENGATASIRRRRARSAAWRTGYDRGIQEGRAAGREDFTRRRVGISKASASSSGPTRATRRRSDR